MTAAGTTPGSSERGRIQAIDLARGLAVCLMILSHGVNGLLRVDQFPPYGIVPIHLITKFSSSLFFIVFGVALAVVYVPKTSETDWPRRRNKLLRRGLWVLLWYKLLTVVEMQDLHDPADIVDALLYRRFPSYVEILGFYSIALLWVPFFLPLWARSPRAAHWLSPLAAAALAWLVAAYVPFHDAEILEALLVEHPSHATWGQLARLPLVLLGLAIGDSVWRAHRNPRFRRRLARGLAVSGALLLVLFSLLFAQELEAQLFDVARNVGKHPPELAFMLFSVGGALGLLALALGGGERLATRLGPVTWVGSDALQAFIFHITVIFVVFRALFGHGVIEYELALALTVGLIFATAIWIRLCGRLRAVGRRLLRTS